jgi:hypothetical protein
MVSYQADGQVMLQGYRMLVAAMLEQRWTALVRPTTSYHKIPQNATFSPEKPNSVGRVHFKILGNLSRTQDAALSSRVTAH